MLHFEPRLCSELWLVPGLTGEFSSRSVFFLSLPPWPGYLKLRGPFLPDCPNAEKSAPSLCVFRSLSVAHDITDGTTESRPVDLSVPYPGL